MPRRYVAVSEAPIHVLERPDLPDFGRPEIGLPGTPEHPWVPGSGFPRPPEGWERPELPPLPPREEWPPLPPIPELPPDWRDRLPVGGTPEHPIVPLPPDPEIDPPPVWPPIIPPFPDVSDKTLALALVYISRRVAVWRWVVIDHTKAKEALKQALDAVKERLPAGGVGGRPPQRPGPA